MARERILGVTNKEGEGVGPDPVIFFCRYVPEQIDLMNLQVDEDLFGGHLAVVTRSATTFLKARSNKQIRAILGICDTWLSLMVGEAIPINVGNGVQPLTRVLLPDIEPMSMLPYAASFADGLSLSIMDVDDSSFAVDDVSAAEVCAAFALGQSAAATKYKHVDWELLNGAYHAMLASQAWGMALALGAGGRGLFIEAATEKLIAERMRTANRKRWELDPTQVMKREIYRRWQVWNMDRSKYPKPGDFRAYVTRDFPNAVDGTLKNWMSRWAKGEDIPEES